MPDVEFAKTYFQPWSKLLLADDGDFISMVWANERYEEHSATTGKKPVTSALGRKFFRTEKGYIGTAPVTIQDGDLIFVLKGGQTPYALRKEEGRYRLVGACVHGLMDGEGMGMGLEEVRFVFVWV
ncbi:hypothetical protein B0T14DRAFT_572088 [Immersiella caudata]|uniref:Uncharacterized protein n=1 Tax=Immersiella caudata TaxID=314043 RepID=A0AA39TQI1_9PEZI|nr:hypothetical protein B0T14DRAFT_572088 [Immersiella caudata]